MSNVSNRKNLDFINYKRILIILIAILAIITIIYQSRIFLDDAQFAWISVSAYTGIPLIMTVYSVVLAIKLSKQKHPDAKTFFLFAIGSSFWFIAEQIWQIYDHILDTEFPFPSEADFFYLGAYPFMAAFMFILLKPIRHLVSRNVWLFAIGLSFSLLIPSLFAAYDDMYGEEAFDTAIVLSYPILSSVLVVPGVVGIMYLSKKGANLFWILILFGFIIYSIADTFFLFVELEGTYYDGHPTDLLFLYTYIMLIFAIHIRYKISKLPSSKKHDMIFSENLKFESISHFGIPLTVAIVCMVILTSLVNAIFFQNEDELSTPKLMLGVVAMLTVFVTIVITINKNLSRMVKMRTTELVEQRDNLENLVEEKTQEVLKSERLSAIGELSGRLAHDLRNPLSVMKMSVDMIKQSSPDLKISDKEVTSRINLIEKSIDRISHQVDDVLEYVRHSPLQLSEVFIDKIIKNSIEKINVPKDVEIILSENKIKINCDEDKMDAVFINLIVNSIQAMHEGGKIEISINEKDNMAILKFIDSGEGISAEDLDKVFEPLYTTKQKGTGLGLASCRNIIEQHQGEISVKNNPTTFIIKLPK